ncbi:MAG: glycosyltransferase family 2 protein [Acidobacteriota bacterium]
MPTFNRRRFVPLAMKYFLRQHYESKEPIIVDDGTDAIGDLIPADDRIRYIRLDKKRTIGAKRNPACEQARGEIILH